ncbi:MAG: NAD(P)H-dependent oxidoreductase subunit E [Kiritimatiellia bacterium]
MSQTHCPECQRQLSEKEMLARLDDILAGHKSTEGAVIPVLQTAQNAFGYLSKPVLKRISRKLNKPYSEVTGIVSFYSFFSTVPRGKYLIRVCLGTACYVRGGKSILEALKRELGIDVGQTTKDRLFSLDIGRCFGACGMAPVIMVNDTVHQRCKAVKIGEIINHYKNQ